MNTRPEAKPFDRALFLDSLLPAVRRELERTVDPTPHGFPVKAIQRSLVYYDRS